MPPPNQSPPDGEALPLRHIESLILPARRGEPDACTKLVTLLYPTVAGVVRNHLPMADDREDAIQDIFVKIFLNLDSFRGDRPITHWVSKIALNTCIDRQRSDRSRLVRPYADYGIDEGELLSRTTSADAYRAAAAPRELVGDLLDRLIATLSPDEQTVIRLVDLAEKTIAETCDITGWGESKVKVTTMRARRKLSATLAELEAPAALHTPT